MTPRVVIEPARLAGSAVLRCQTDDRLVDLVRAGNDRAFEAIVERYHRPLLRHCSRLLPPGRAEDAVQQAFLNAFAALRRNDHPIDLRPWLYRIAYNAALNALRENGWSHECIEAVQRPGGERPDEAVERRTSVRTVLAAVQDLPERQRDAMILRELEGRTYEQIGHELDATDGAVRQLLNRARHTLRAGATAVTPAGLLSRLPWGQGAVIERVAEAAAHDGLRVGAARVSGAVVAAVAVAAGLSEGTRTDFAEAIRDGSPASLGADAAQASRTSPGSLDRALAAAQSGGAPRLARLPAPVPTTLTLVPPRPPARAETGAARGIDGLTPTGAGLGPGATTPVATLPHTHEHTHTHTHAHAAPRGRRVQVGRRQEQNRERRERGGAREDAAVQERAAAPEPRGTAAARAARHAGDRGRRARADEGERPGASGGPARETAGRRAERQTPDARPR